jgi:carboxylesterase type B
MPKFETVKSEYGPIKGVHKTSAIGYNYISFQGIPYMKPPIGKLRFKEPQEPSKFQKTFDATGDASAYVAINPITFQCEGQEDAGILNVFTKDVKPKKLRPVMIWVSKN